VISDNVTNISATLRGEHVAFPRDNDDDICFILDLKVHSWTFIVLAH